VSRWSAFAPGLCVGAGLGADEGRRMGAFTSSGGRLPAQACARGKEGHSQYGLGRGPGRSWARPMLQRMAWAVARRGL
jgi:hypothetical protein